MLAIVVMASLASVSAGRASPAPVAAPGFSSVVHVRVDCARVRHGKKITTYFCPNGYVCRGGGSAWKCDRKPSAVMSCSVCYSNQKRDGDACTRAGDLMSQSACVNRVNGELMRCLGHCQ
ncbi:MAG: hypothetical protein KGI57_10375 [Hyphomicrobiales bacterium]|nr:hypothetical protein [Hyphomicrobiales bacterium]